MKPKNITAIIAFILLLAIFNVFFFLFLGTNHSTTSWISYGLINVALLTLLIPICLSETDSRLETLNNALYLITIIYVILEVIVGLICILIKVADYRVPLFIQVLFLAIYGILILLNIRANKATRCSIQHQDRELIYVNKASANLKLIMDMLSEKEVRIQVEKAYDIIHSSPTRSHISVEPLENEIMNAIDALHSNVLNHEYRNVVNDAEKIASMANQRNMKLKLLQK